MWREIERASEKGYFTFYKRGMVNGKNGLIQPWMSRWVRVSSVHIWANGGFGGWSGQEAR